MSRMMNSRSDWPRVAFGDVVRLNTDRVAEPAAAGMEHTLPDDPRLHSRGLMLAE